MPLKIRTNLDAPAPTREELRNVLAVALGGSQPGQPRPISTYEPLAWLLRDDVGNRSGRRTRRSLYRKLVHELAREFNRIYTERVTAPNGPWDFGDVYVAVQEARRCIRRMNWCAFQHLCHLPGAGTASARAYERIVNLFSRAAHPRTA